MKRAGPRAELDANGVRVGLNGWEPKGTEAGGSQLLTFESEGSLEETGKDFKSRDVELVPDGDLPTRLGPRRYLLG